MKYFATLFVSATLLASVAWASEAALEAIGADGALANVQEREGIVFVDLFADW
jgi:hypothetical protein